MRPDTPILLRLSALAWKYYSGLSALVWERVASLAWKVRSTVPGVMIMELTDRSGSGFSSDAHPMGYPTRLDLGDVLQGAFCQIQLPLDACEDAPTRWSLDPENEGFDARSENDFLTVSLPTAAAGRHVCRLTLRSATEETRVNITESVQAGDDLARWPTVPDLKKAHAVLAAWASQHRLVPDWLFDGDLSLSDASVVRASLLVQCEETAKRHQEAPSLPDIPICPRSGRQVILDIDGWEDSSWEMVLAGSVAEHKCHDCGPSHQVPCLECGGTGAVYCPPTVTCEDCEGSSTGRSIAKVVLAGVDEWAARQKSGSEPGGALSTMLKPDANANEPCQTCYGKGRVPCPRCEGSGSRRCDSCIRGQAPCRRCGGDGRFAEYDQISGSRNTYVDSVTIGDVSSLPPGHEQGYRALETSSTDLLMNVPTEHRAALDRWIRQRLRERRRNEIVRRLWIEVLPVIAVEYSDGSVSRTAYLIGDDAMVFAPAATHPNIGRLKTSIQRWRAKHLD